MVFPFFGLAVALQTVALIVENLATLEWLMGCRRRVRAAAMARVFLQV